MLLDGILEVYKDNALLGRMEVGRAFGELALLYNCKRTASVRGEYNIMRREITSILLFWLSVDLDCCLVISTVTWQ